MIVKKEINDTRRINKTINLKIKIKRKTKQKRSRVMFSGKSDSQKNI